MCWVPIYHMDSLVESERVEDEELQDPDFTNDGCLPGRNLDHGPYRSDTKSWSTPEQDGHERVSD